MAKKQEILVVVSKVKDYIKSKKMMTSSDLAPTLIAALSETIHETLDGAITRCQGNKRSTVRADDL